MPPLLVAGAGAAGLMLAGIVAFLVLGVASGPVDWGELLTDSDWDPGRGQFGAAAMVWGTAAVSTIALALAAPVGWGAAIGIVELAPPRLRSPLRAASELLAVVPSIVYGLIGIWAIRPLIAGLTGSPSGDGLLTAGLVLAVMILPSVVAISADTLARVPAEVREAAASLGLLRTEVVRRAVLPAARPGMTAALLLALARAAGETIAVFLLIGRADGRLPSPGEALSALAEPGQTLTTKLNGPETILAGTSGEHWAALSALGLLLLLGVAALALLGATAARRRGRRSRARFGRGRVRARRARDRLTRAGVAVALALPPALFTLLLGAVLVRGSSGLDPSFWLAPPSGAAGGGIRDQLLGTLLLVGAAGLIAAPIGLGLGISLAEYTRGRWRESLRTSAIALASVPSILLGLGAYFLFSGPLGSGKSWLAGSLALAVIAIPVIALSVAQAVADTAPELREAGMALGLRHRQLVRSLLVPASRPALITGVLLGLARAAGETAPLLFTATVFSGATLPTGIADSPVTALPTHVFALAQDSARPEAIETAWSTAAALIIVAGLLVLGALLARRRIEGVPL